MKYKYNIGDIVKIKKVNYLIYRDGVGIILEKIRSDHIAYRVLISGIEGIKHYVYEDEIENKIE